MVVRMVMLLLLLILLSDVCEETFLLPLQSNMILCSKQFLSIILDLF